MTAVAAISPSGYPAFVGDLLLSAETPVTVQKSIPTVGNISEKLKATYHVTGLRQKIVLVSSEVVLGWAGSMIAARMVINDLRQLVTRRKMLLKNFDDYFRGLDSWVRQQELSIIGHVASTEDGGWFHYNTWHTSVPPFGDVWVAGAGSWDMVEIMRQVPEKIELGGLNSFERAIILALTLSGTLTNEELSTQSNLDSFYGGGYEVCTWRKDAFRKIEDITYLWWTLQAREVGSFALSKGPRRVLKYTYEDDLLVIYALDLQGHIQAHFWQLYK